MPDDIAGRNSTPAIDADRLWADMMALGALTEPDRPYTRRAFSPLFAEGRAYLARRYAEAGLSVRVDTAGNLIGRLEGSDPTLGAIAMGSHSDTVPGGGRFDGIAGVVAALEVASALHDRSERLRHPIEVIDFLAEEPSDFGLSCIGSRGIAGALDPSMMEMTDPKGAVLRDALAAVGGDPANLAAAKRDDFAAFVELHIEQGPVLEAKGLDIAAVTSIVGIRRVEIVFEGEAAHAGTAPMDLRKDAAYAGALTLVAVRQLAETLAARGDEYFVATIGIVDVKPGGSNVVPGRCRLVIDARSSSMPVNADFVAAIDKASLEAAATARVERTTYLTLSDGPPAISDPRVRDAIRASADRLGYTAMDLASGAGHDAAFMARVCPSAMIFIPCLKGMSHHPDEWATQDELAKGTAVMLETLRALDVAFDG